MMNNTKTIVIYASECNVEAEGKDSLYVEAEQTEEEYNRTIRDFFGPKDIIAAIGAAELLEAMDLDDIRGWLDGIGMKTCWED